MSETEISIRPGVGMLGLFPYMKYQPWYALSELVDNAIQSHLSERQRLFDADSHHRLEISIATGRNENGWIVVRDNAAGIAAKDWERAFQVAEPPTDATGLSQFGVGMKAACCWFAKDWSVRTSALGEAVVREVAFDIPKIIETRNETLAVAEDPAGVGDHFTVIEMRNLHRPIAGRTLGKVREYLGGIYRQFLRDGELSLTVNDEPVVFVEPTVLEAQRYNDPNGPSHRWHQDVDVVLSSGRRVTGFVAIRETGDARQAGLALLYRGKVVTGSGEDFYKPSEIFQGGNSFQSQRIFGELHMNAFEVTYTKDALVWYDEEEEFVDLLREHLDGGEWPLIKQAREYRKRQPEEATGVSAREALENIVDAFVSHEYEIEGATTDDTSTEPVGASPAPVSSHELTTPEPVDRKIEISYRDTTWNVELRLVADVAVSRWLTVKKESSIQSNDRLILTVNQAHPFMRAWCELPSQELEPVWRVALALGLAQEMARLEGAQMPGLVTENVNGLLRTVLSHKN